MHFFGSLSFVNYNHIYDEQTGRTHPLPDFFPGRSSSKFGHTKIYVVRQLGVGFLARLHLVFKLLSVLITGCQSVAALLSSDCFPGALHLPSDCVRLFFFH
jgi:hypothetical protein